MKALLYKIVECFAILHEYIMRINDKFEYRSDDFVYNKHREDLMGTHKFPKSIFQQIYDFLTCICAFFPL